MNELNLLNTDQFRRNGPYFFPTAAFAENRAEASKQYLSFEHAKMDFFTNRFNSAFLTNINRKNKRTHDTDHASVTSPDFASIDDLSSAGLCNQLIESFVIDYCCQQNLRLPGHSLNLTYEYKNQLSFYQTTCFAPFRRSTRVYYVDEVVARKTIVHMLASFIQYHTGQSVEIPYSLRIIADIDGLDVPIVPDDMGPYIDLYLHMSDVFNFRKSSTVERLVDAYRSLERDLAPIRPMQPPVVTLNSIRWSTVGQLNFFRWFIGEGGMALLLRHRTDAVQFLEDKRRRSNDNKQRRRSIGHLTRQRTVTLRPRQCIVSSVTVDCIQTIP